MIAGTTARNIILGIAVIAVLFAINSWRPAAIARAELSADDLRMYARGTPPPTGMVAIVAIDDGSIAKVGRWPWPRSELARLVSTLRDSKVAVIGMDLLFAEPDDIDRDHRALAGRF